MAQQDKGSERDAAVRLYAQRYPGREPPDDLDVLAGYEPGDATWAPPPGSRAVFEVDTAGIRSVLQDDGRHRVARRRRRDVRRRETVNSKGPGPRGPGPLGQSPRWNGPRVKSAARISPDGCAVVCTLTYAASLRSASIIS